LGVDVSGGAASRTIVRIAPGPEERDSAFARFQDAALPVLNRVLERTGLYLLRVAPTDAAAAGEWSQSVLVAAASNPSGIATSSPIPASSSSFGEPGMVACGDDGGTVYLYVCAAPNYWRRVALSSF
jgi:hypothetical protein